MAEKAFIDIAVLDGVRERLLAGQALLVFSAEDAEPVWANGAAASLFGKASVEDILESGIAGLGSASRQLQMAVGSGEGTAFLRLRRGLRAELVKVTLDTLVINDRKALIVAAFGEETRDEDPEKVISGLDDGNAGAALLDGSGRVLVANEAFTQFGLRNTTLNALVQETATEDDRLVKRLLHEDDLEKAIAAGIGRLRDARSLFLGIVAAESDMDPDDDAAQPTVSRPIIPTSATTLYANDSEIGDKPEMTQDVFLEPAERPQVDVEAETLSNKDAIPDIKSDHTIVNSEDDESEQTQAEPVTTGQEIAVGAADEDEVDAEFQFDPSSGPIRFVWRMDADGVFVSISPEFVCAVGPAASDLEGNSFDAVSEALGLDPDREIANALARRDTWSGKTMLWPVEGTDLRVPVDLAALPYYNRDRVFEGYRGFGVIRTGDTVIDPLGTGYTLVQGRNQAAETTQSFENPIDEHSASDDETDSAVSSLALTHDATDRDPTGEQPAHESQPHSNDHQSQRGLDDQEKAAFAKIGETLSVHSASNDDDVVSQQPDDTVKEALRAQFDDGEPVHSTSQEDSSKDDFKSYEDEAGTNVGSGSSSVKRNVWDFSKIAGARHVHAQVANEHAGSHAMSDDQSDDTDQIDQSDISSNSQFVHDDHDIAGVMAQTMDDEANDDGSTIAPDDQQAPDQNHTIEVDNDSEKDLKTAPHAENPVHASFADSGDEATSVGDDETEAAYSYQHIDRSADSNSAQDEDTDTTDQVGGVSGFAHNNEPVGSRGLDADVLDNLPLALLVVSEGHLRFANMAFQVMTGYDDIADLEEQGGIDGLIDGPSSVVEHDGDGPARRAVTLIAADGDRFAARAHMQIVPFEGMKSLMLAFEPINQDNSEETPYVSSRHVGTVSDDVPPRQSADVIALHDTGSHDGTAELKQRIDELESILDIASDGVVIVDNRGMIRSINGPGAALFGYDKAELEDTSFSILFAHESQRKALDYLNSLSDNGVASLINEGREVLGREKAGGFLPLFITIGHLPASDMLCAVLRDITPWKQSEQALKDAKRNAEEASSSKSEFLARISHEIRTPLNAIIGFSELIQEERFGALNNQRYKDYLADINASGRHVLDLVNDLLDLSKIEAGKQEMSFAGVDLNSIIDDAIAMVQPQASRARIIIRSSFDPGMPQIVADERSIRQIALNLLSNSIRFTHSGGLIVVSTSYNPETGVTARVKDTGVGMTQKEIETAMQPFQQVAQQHVSRRDGTGLGLPLTLALVEANRAEFDIHSEPGQGTIVEIRFPQTRVLGS